MSASATPVPGVDHDPLAPQPRSGLAQQLLLAQQPRAPAGDLPAELAQRTQGGGAAQPVGDEPVLALELLERGLGLLVEHPARSARVVPELEEALLQRDDVVAAHRGGDQEGEHPVAQLPPGLA
jgi:hypothetical protein